MAKYTHAYVIPDSANIKGGVLYDRWGNLAYFANVDALLDLTQTGQDKESTVKQYSRGRFMNSSGSSTVSSTTRYFSTGIRQSKGALPGYTITIASDEGQANEEKRQFQYTGTMSGLIAWLKTTANLDLRVYGKTGTPSDPIPAVSAGAASLVAR